MSKLLWISAVSLVAISLQVADASAGLPPVRSAAGKASGQFYGVPHTMHCAAPTTTGVTVPAPADESYRSFSFEPGATGAAPEAAMTPAPVMNYVAPARRSRANYLSGSHKFLGIYSH